MRGACWRQRSACPARSCSARPRPCSAPSRPTRFARYVARRAAREPVSRILGEREFYGRTFKLSPATLDPRPDSETLIEVALGFVDQAGLRAAPLRILDVGTGSGCLLTTLLCELPAATGIGTDISQAALRHGARQRAAARRRRTRDVASGRCARRHRRPVRYPCVQSALHPLGRHRRARSRGPRLRSARRARRRQRRPGDLSAHGAAPTGRWFRTDGPLFEVGYDQADAVADLLASATGARNPPTLSLHRDVAGKRRCVAWRTRA